MSHKDYMSQIRHFLFWTLGPVLVSATLATLGQMRKIKMGCFQDCQVFFLSNVCIGAKMAWWPGSSLTFRLHARLLARIRREWGMLTVTGPYAFGSCTGPVNTELSNVHSLTTKFLYMQTRACSLRKHSALPSTCPAAWDLNRALRAANEMLVWLNSLAKLWSFPGASPLCKVLHWVISQCNLGKWAFPASCLPNCKMRKCFLTSKRHWEQSIPEVGRETLKAAGKKWVSSCFPA